MSKILLLFINSGALYEYRREACLKSYTDIISFDNLESIDKIGSIEANLIVSFDFSIDLDFTRTNLSITWFEFDSTSFLETHFDIKIILSSDETHLAERLYELAPIDESMDARALREKIGIVREVSIEETRVEEDIFVDEEYLIISEKYLHIDSLRESFHDFISTAKREDNRDFFIDTTITIISVLWESKAICRSKSNMVWMELDIHSG